MDNQAVRDDIVSAARNYFTRFGYSRVSTSEIAGSIGRSKKTLYKLFPTKEELLRAVLAQMNAEVEARIVAALADDGGPYVERLRRVLALIGVHHASVGGELFRDLQATSPELHDQGRAEQRARLGALIRRLLDDGIAARAIRRDVDSEVVTATFLSSAEALADPVRLAQHASDPTRVFATLVTLLVDGLRPPHGSGASS